LIRCISPFLVEEYWHHIAPHLPKACKRTGGSSTPDWYFRQCQTGQGNYLLSIDGQEIQVAIVATFETWAGERCLHINAVCGGSIPIWQAIKPDLEEWAANHGATSIIYDAKRTHDRLFPDGVPLHTVYKKKIGPKP